MGQFGDSWYLIYIGLPKNLVETLNVLVWKTICLVKTVYFREGKQLMIYV